MIRTPVVEQNVVKMLPLDRRKISHVFYNITFQCLLVGVGAATVLGCAWSFDNVNSDINKLIRIMYLHDSQYCGDSVLKSLGPVNLEFSTDNTGASSLNVTALDFKRAYVTVSSKLSSKTRLYITISLVLHVLWFIATVPLRFMSGLESINYKYFIYALSTYMMFSIVMIIFDISMAILYISHIKQCLTNAMVLRYSGYSVDMKLNNYSHFAGWLPMAGSICWLRGVFFFLLNILHMRKVYHIHKKIKKKDVFVKLELMGNLAFPEYKPRPPTDTEDESVIYFHS